MDAIESEQIERALRLELTRVDIQLKTKQAFWETPRNLLIVVGAAVAISSTIAGYLGYQAGSAPQRPIIVQMAPFAPGPAAPSR